MSRASRSDGAGQNDKNLINHMQMQRRKKLRGGRVWAVLLFCACLLSGGALWTRCRYLIELYKRSLMVPLSNG